MSLVVPLDEIFGKQQGLLGQHGTWERVKIGEACTVLNGYPFKSELFNREKGFPIIRIRDLSTGSPVTLYDGEVEPQFIIQNGDLLVGMDGNFRCVEWLGGPAGLNQRVCKISPDERFLLRRLLLYGLNGYLNAIQEATSSITVGHLSSRDILEIPFPLPPAAEQRRIVAKLDALLARVDACRQRLEKIPRLLARFRQSVLAAACSGRLTADWRALNPGTASAADFLGRLTTPVPPPHEGVFEQTSGHEIPDSWAWAPLGRLGTVTGGGTPSKENSLFWGGHIPWVSPKDMKRDRIQDSEDHITDAALTESSTKSIAPGSILFVVRGMILNHTLPTAITDAVVTLNQDMKALTPEEPQTGEYLFLASKFLAKRILFEVKEATHGTRRIETGLLKNWAVPIPPLCEQEEIVRRVDQLFAFADRLETRVQTARKRVDALTQSILAKAFRGELVPTEAELAEAEGRPFESAEQLLNRIRSERETRPTPRGPDSASRKAKRSTT